MHLQFAFDDSWTENDNTLLLFMHNISKMNPLRFSNQWKLFGNFDVRLSNLLQQV